MAGSTNLATASAALDAITDRGGAGTYLALLTAAPTPDTSIDTGDVTELTTPASNGYDREAVTFTDPASDPEGDDRTTSNSAEITFGPFTSDLSAVTHVALCDAATGDAAIYYLWKLDTARNPDDNDSIVIAANALKIQVASQSLA